MNGSQRRHKPPGSRSENGRDGERLRWVSAADEKPELVGGENEGKFEQVEVTELYNQH